MVDRDTYFHNDLKITVDGLKTSNHSDLASIDLKVGDLAGFKTQNHSDLDALNTSFVQLSNWLKKKLAYSFDFDLITKNLTFSEDDVDNNGYYYIPSSEFEVGKSYLLRINCLDDFSSWGTVSICLPVGDFIIGGVTSKDESDAFTKYSQQMTNYPHLVRSGSTHGMYNDAYVLGSLTHGGYIYLWGGLQRCSDV